MGSKKNPGEIISDLFSGGESSKMAKRTANAVATQRVTEDPNTQRDQAEAEARARLARELGARGGGLKSTILGGSTVADDSNLKKKKLLGE